MSIILTPGHIEIAESEFIGRHPDTLSTCLAAELVYSIAAQVHVQNSGLLSDYTKGKLLNPTTTHLQGIDASVEESYGLENLRADVNVQISAINSKNIIPIPLRINLVGQIAAPQFQQTDLDQIVRETTFDVFSKAGYFLHGDFVPEYIKADTQGVTAQSPNLNRTTQHNTFADSCVVYGHYIREPFGIDGTFPSLVIAKEIDRILEETARQGTIPELRPDGKVHVSVVRESKGYRIRDVYLSVAHSKNPGAAFREKIAAIASQAISCYPGGEHAHITVNGGGNFNFYFVNADSGISGKKDSVIVTGGIHQLGTDGIWGKCLYKASSSALPYAFALSRAVCDVTGATYACVGVYTRYGQEQAELILQDIDPKYESIRENITRALRTLPRDRDGIRDLLNMKVNLNTYGTFNDVRGFHEPTKPWKSYNPNLAQALTKALSKP